MSAYTLPHACPEMSRFVTDTQVPVSYNARFREYSLSLQGSGGHQLIDFCPWCGAELPGSLRDAFFDEMDRLGIEYPDEDPPEPYVGDVWWRSGAGTAEP